VAARVRRLSASDRSGRVSLAGWVDGAARAGSTAQEWPFLKEPDMVLCLKTVVSKEFDNSKKREFRFTCPSHRLDFLES